jgi:hypothetical protein
LSFQRIWRRDSNKERVTTKKQFVLDTLPEKYWTPAVKQLKEGPQTLLTEQKKEW